MREYPGNARWWQWTGIGWVKFTLRPGETITLFKGHPTEEGWYREWSVLEHVGDGVTSELTSEERDCDGLIDYQADHFCPLANLKARDMEAAYEASENVGISAPEWERRSASQRDYAAEAAGY